MQVKRAAVALAFPAALPITVPPVGATAVLPIAAELAAVLAPTSAALPTIVLLVPLVSVAPDAVFA